MVGVLDRTLAETKPRSGRATEPLDTVYLAAVGDSDALVRTIAPAGPYVDTVDAPSPQDPKTLVKLGLRKDTFETNYLEHHLMTAVAQYYGIVQDGMVGAQHVFHGLRRPLMLGLNKHADEAVWIYSWSPPLDYLWVGNRYNGDPVPRKPPPGNAFVVIVRTEDPNELGVTGSIERWNWVREHPTLPHAPIAWEQRYDEKLWSLPA